MGLNDLKIDDGDKLDPKGQNKVKGGNGDNVPHGGDKEVGMTRRDFLKKLADGAKTLGIVGAFGALANCSNNTTKDIIPEKPVPELKTFTATPLTTTAGNTVKVDFEFDINATWSAEITDPNGKTENIDIREGSISGVGKKSSFKFSSEIPGDSKVEIVWFVNGDRHFAEKIVPFT